MQSTMTKVENAREAQIRRLATRQGLTLRRSRTRRPESAQFGTYAVFDEQGGFMVFGDHLQGYGLTLDDAEAALQMNATQD